MRIVVTEVIQKKSSEPPKVDGAAAAANTSGSSVVGTLFLVTCTGGTIGREGNHDVLVQDIGCSKFHAKIEFK